MLGLFLNIQCYNKHIIFAKHLLLVCRYSVDFCMLILYPVILLNLLIRFSSCCVYFIWFVGKQACYLCIKPILILPFQIAYLLSPSLFPIISLTRTIRTVLIRSSEWRLQRPVLSLGRKQAVSWLSMMLTMLFYRCLLSHWGFILFFIE